MISKGHCQSVPCFHACTQKQADSDQKGGEREIMVEKRGRDYLKRMYEQPMDMDNSVGIDWRSWGRDGRRRAKGGNWDSCNRITILKISLKRGHCDSLAFTRTLINGIITLINRKLVDRLDCMTANKWQNRDVKLIISNILIFPILCRV